MKKTGKLGATAFCALASVTGLAYAGGDDGVAEHRIHYHTIKVQGLDIFYREAGPAGAPVVLLLHGFPSSSRMYEALMPALADRYHLIAPDYPGFGHSDAPSPDQFSYTFDHIASVMDDLTNQLGLKRYTLFMQDYGGPVGFRLALLHGEKVDALIVQNAAAHEEALGPLWATRRAYWMDRAANADKLRANLISFEAAKQRHLGSSPHPDYYDPDAWTDEAAFLARPGEGRIQEELFYDYRTNVTSYPKWQDYLRTRKPPTLVLWGKYDPSFMVEGAAAYKRDVPNAEVHILDAGHFAMDEQRTQVQRLTRDFLDRHDTAK